MYLILIVPISDGFCGIACAQEISDRFFTGCSLPVSVSLSLSLFGGCCGDMAALSKNLMRFNRAGISPRRPSRRPFYAISSVPRSSSGIIPSFPILHPLERNARADGTIASNGGPVESPSLFLSQSSRSVGAIGTPQVPIDPLRERSNNRISLKRF